MAATTITVSYFDGLANTVSAKIGLLGVGAIEETVPLTESRPGLYVGTVNGAIAGNRLLELWSATDKLADFVIPLADDAGPYHAGPVAATEAQVNAARDAVVARGDLAWVTGVGGGGAVTLSAAERTAIGAATVVEMAAANFATVADLTTTQQAIMTTGGPGPWTSGSGAAGTSSAALLPRLKPALPLHPDRNTIIRIGADHLAADSRALEYSPTNDCGIVANGWPDLTGATIEWRGRECPGSTTITAAGSVVTATGEQLVRVELTKLQTEVPAGRYDYSVWATLANGSEFELETGIVHFEM